MKKQQGFTLIELLVVVGILAILAIAALIAINPLEAQRRARDSTRLADLARLSAVMETYMNDEGIATLADSDTQGSGNRRSDTCGATNWLGVDLCQFLKQVPVDPQNARVIAVIDAVGARAQETAGYGFAIDTATGGYEICAFLEAEKNVEILESDGGSDANIFETGTQLALPCNPSP